MGLLTELIFDTIASQVGKIAQSRADRATNDEQIAVLKADADNERRRNEERAAQLAALKEAAPKTIPQKMRATIQIHSFRISKTEQKEVKNFLAESNYIAAPAGELIRFAVDMLLELSETERALVFEHHLDAIPIEEDALLDARTIRDIERDNARDLEATKDPLLKEVRRQGYETAMNITKPMKNTTRLGDYLVFPFSRTFHEKHEATMYAGKLKTKILPHIREILDSYLDYKATDTIEL